MNGADLHRSAVAAIDDGAHEETVPDRHISHTPLRRAFWREFRSPGDENQRMKRARRGSGSVTYRRLCGRE